MTASVPKLEISYHFVRRELKPQVCAFMPKILGISQTHCNLGAVPAIDHGTDLVYSEGQRNGH